MRKASAWYYVAYKAGTILSFGWVMDHFMSDIVKRKQLIQQDHEALKIIGEAICKRGWKNLVEDLVLLWNIDEKDYNNMSETEKLGSQFLNIIEIRNQSEPAQKWIHEWLTFLQNVALNAA